MTGSVVRQPVPERKRGAGRKWLHAVQAWRTPSGFTRLCGMLGIMTLILAGCELAAGAETGIYVVRPSAGAPGWIGGPQGVSAWSPDHDLLAWGNEDGLFVAAPGGGLEKLTDAYVGGRPAWSPDGNAIAFINRDRGQLVVIDVGTGAIRFTEPIERLGTRLPLRFPVMLGGPSWSPDGSRLAFVCFDGSGDEVCVIGADGTGRKQVTQLEPVGVMPGTRTPLFTPAGSNAGPAAWSPDGSLLAIAAYPERLGAPQGVFVVDPEKGKARRVSDLLPTSTIGWFPNGRSLYFSGVEPDQYTRPDPRSDVFHVYIRAGAERNLTEALPMGARNPALSPDGTRLAMESNGEILIWSEHSFPQEVSIEGMSATYPSWSADGTAVAFSAGIDPISVYNYAP